MRRSIPTAQSTQNASATIMGLLTRLHSLEVAAEGANAKPEDKSLPPLALADAEVAAVTATLDKLRAEAAAGAETTSKANQQRDELKAQNQKLVPMPHARRPL